MVICAVFNCRNRSVRDSHVSYFNFPRIIENKGEKIKEVSKRRRKEWLTRINRADLSDSNIKHKKVCSVHFILGKPADLFDETNPDWAPSLKLGHSKYKADVLQASDRYNRSFQRKGVRKVLTPTGNATTPLTSNLGPATPATISLVANIPDDNERDSENEDHSSGNINSTAAKKFESVAIQTECSMSFITSLEVEIGALRREKEELQNKLNRSTFSAEEADDAQVQFYTALPSAQMLRVVFDFISPRVQYKPIALTLFQSFFIFLMRLRLNLVMQDLAYRFAVSQPTVARIFNAWLDAAFVSMSPTILWPERSVLKSTMPTEFKMVFGTRVAVIVDCFEVNIDRPTSLTARIATWSNYKHHNTIKLLIGISPQGVITYISEAWGGRVSDKYITENCGMLDNLLPGDYVMADRGFNIGDAIGFCCAELLKPASARGKQQLSPQEIHDTRKIASLRIHVERAIGNLRQKYTILKGQLPVEYLTLREGEDCTPVDKVVVVCCGFANLSKTIVAII